MGRDDEDNRPLTDQVVVCSSTGHTGRHCTELMQASKRLSSGDKYGKVYERRKRKSAASTPENLPPVALMHPGPMLMADRAATRIADNNAQLLARLVLGKKNVRGPDLFLPTAVFRPSFEEAFTGPEMIWMTHGQPPFYVYCFDARDCRHKMALRCKRENYILSGDLHNICGSNQFLANSVLSIYQYRDKRDEIKLIFRKTCTFSTEYEAQNHHCETCSQPLYHG